MIFILSGLPSGSCWTSTSPASIHLDKKRLYQFNQCRRPTPFIYLNKFICAHMAGVSPPCCFSFSVCANCINMPRGLIELLTQSTISGHSESVLWLFQNRPCFSWGWQSLTPWLPSPIWTLRSFDAPPKSRDRRKGSAIGWYPPLVPESTKSYSQPLLSWDYVVGQMGKLGVQCWPPLGMDTSARLYSDGPPLRCKPPVSSTFMFTSQPESFILTKEVPSQKTECSLKLQMSLPGLPHFLHISRSKIDR